jgi:hypothetical protein
MSGRKVKRGGLEVNGHPDQRGNRSLSEARDETIFQHQLLN